MTELLVRPPEHVLNVHPEVTGVEVLAGIRADLAVQDRGDEIPDEFPGKRFLTTFRAHIEGLDDDWRGMFDAHLKKGVTDKIADQLVVAQPDAPGELLKLDDRSLVVVLGAHVQLMGERQATFAERYAEYERDYEEKLQVAILEGRLPWYAASSLENLDKSRAWVLDYPAIRKKYPVAANAMVYTHTGQVFVRDMSDRDQERRSSKHEMTHLLSIGPEEDRNTWQEGLLYFPVEPGGKHPHIWLNEAMTEYLNGDINNHPVMSYPDERKLLYSIFRAGSPQLRVRATDAYFAHDGIYGIDADEMRGELYHEMSAITQAAGLGSITEMQVLLDDYRVEKPAAHKALLNVFARIIDPRKNVPDPAAEIEVAKRVQEVTTQPQTKAA